MALKATLSKRTFEKMVHTTRDTNFCFW
jgi:hypothetical protein